MKRLFFVFVFCLLGVVCFSQWQAGKVLSARSIDQSHLDRYFTAEPISDSLFQRIWLNSFKRNCTTKREELRYLKVLHVNKDGLPQMGELICNKAIAKDLLAIFRELYENSYRIEKMLLIDNYNADDEASMADNNTSCFNYRTIAGTNQPSLHGRGLAIDINPLINPCLYVRTGKVSPANGKPYAHNRTNKPGQSLRYIDRNDLCYRLFTKRGFTWGGSWGTVHDYQHFEKKTLTATTAPAQDSFSLNSGWTFRQERLRNWHDATVPGTVQTDLMAIGSIEDPFYALNERTVQWIDKEDWLYDNHFNLTEAQQQRTHRELTFYGLDTYADVWLNDSLILKANNMFRTWHADITRFTRVGDNHLRVRLYSPVKIDMPKWERFPNQYHASSDQSQNGGLLDRQISPFARKAGYHYGWDWGPRILTMGIWRPVVYTAWDNLTIRDVFVEQVDVTRKRADIQHHVTIEADNDMTATITVTDSATQHCLASQEVSLHRGINNITLPYTVQNPHLWWTNALGEPYLYTLQTTVKGQKTTESCQFSTRVGLRSLQLHRETDADGKGEAFYFTLNGEKVFMKGANYIPCDIFLPRVSDSVYQRTIADAVAVNMNMLRVWGGGVYEDDRFYELCDENGILVWQDFMFACSMYPATGEWLNNVRQEAIDNVKRLRNHPCMALWCGNNEVQDAWFGWGWKRQSEQLGHADRLWAEYKDLFFRTLPEVVKQYAPQTAYHPSSPFSNYEGKSEFTRGDYHYWEVWHGRKPISEYNKVRARFFSEYGMQSFPELTTVKRFVPDTKDWEIASDVMMAHQRGGAHANGLIESYLNTEYGRPQGFDTLLYVGQLMQGDAMKTAVEAHRRDKGYCWGSLLWQINDCWPVASWSTRDYYGRWKAAHYMVRPAMADILVSPIQTEDSTLHVYIVNDRMTPINGQLTIDVYTTSERRITLTRSVKVNANSSTDAWQMPTAQLLTQAGISADQAIIHAEFISDKATKEVYSNNYILVYPKELKLQPSHVQAKVDGKDITISTDRYARGIYLTLDGDDNHHFSDNYFDLLPGEQRTISVISCLPPAEMQRRLQIMVYK